MTEAQLLDTVKDVRRQLDTLVLDMDTIVGVPVNQRTRLNDVRRRLAQIHGRLGVAIVAYDSGAVTELPDGDPRDCIPYERTR